ncbi:MAG TPA: FAD-dependent oxidoreductase, partial [Candidatus Binatia bacterium]|nr:FAD-dependent oxidoreductase [Candidatus Binatia bacterium]
ALSTDFVGESAPYIEADHAAREQIWEAHRNYEQGLLYFLATDPRVPSNVRNAMSNYGFCKDEFTDNGGWPYELYVREARRMVSDYVMTQSNVFNQVVVPDSIGMAGYFTDSHYLQRVVISGHPRNEGDARGDITLPYPIAYRALVPKTNECSNLLVPWSLSASHTAFCSIRMEPVFMILGQAAGTAACFAIDEETNVQGINISKLQAQLVADNQAIGMAGSSAIIVDNADVTGVDIVGSWTSSSATAGYYGGDYLHDGNTNKGQSSVTFTPTLPQTDLYQVYARWSANANRASNVPIDIISPSGTTTVVVDQTQQGGQWVLLLTTNFNAGTAGKVRIRNDGTAGYVIADAVKFVEGENLPLIGIWPTDAAASRLGPVSGSVTVTRSGNTNVPVTVGFNIGGSAVNGSDYHPIGNSMLLPAGVTKSQITILPYTNSAPVGEKSVTISVATNAAYRVGSLNSANILIEDVPINAWRFNYFGANATNEAIAGDMADPAGDGVPNLMKYALGLDPNQPAHQPLITPELSTNGYFQIIYARPDPPPADISYRLESSNDLSTWCTNGCTSTQQILFNTNTATIVSEDPTPFSGQPAKFVRLRISRM